MVLSTLILKTLISYLHITNLMNFEQNKKSAIKASKHFKSNHGDQFFSSETSKYEDNLNYNILPRRRLH